MNRRCWPVSGEAICAPRIVTAEFSDEVDYGRTGPQSAAAEPESHGSVISPLSRRESEGTSADHVCDRAEASRLLELERCATGIADGKAQEASTISLSNLHFTGPLPFPSLGIVRSEYRNY